MADASKQPVGTEPPELMPALPARAHALPQTGFLRARQILGDPRRGQPALIPISRTTLWNWVRNGRFPAPHKLGPNVTAWRVEDVRELLARIAAGESVSA